MGNTDSSYSSLTTQIEMTAELEAVETELEVNGVVPPCNTPTDNEVSDRELSLSDGEQSGGSVVVVDKALYTKYWTDLPLPMKSMQGVFLDGVLYLGGGFTGSSKTDVLIHAHNFASGEWSQLPPCPMKWSALSVLEHRLVLIGGREVCDNKLTLCTNKVAVWNRVGQKWECTLPPMIVPRMSPVVISHRGHLIVAGGKKGSLDYHAEVLMPQAKRWVCGPALPLPCLTHTSTVMGGEWYLLDQKSGMVQHASISAYIKTIVPSGGLFNNVWTKLDNSPPATSFRIASTNSHLLAFSEAQGLISAHIYERDMWCSVESRLPSTLTNGGLMLAGDTGRGVLYVIGGQTGHAYSNTSYRLTFMTHEDLRLVKKSRQTTLSLSE